MRLIQNCLQLATNKYVCVILYIILYISIWYHTLHLGVVPRKRTLTLAHTLHLCVTREKEARSWREIYAFLARLSRVATLRQKQNKAHTQNNKTLGKRSAKTTTGFKRDWKRTESPKTSAHHAKARSSSSSRARWACARAREQECRTECTHERGFRTHTQAEQSK